MTKATLIYDGDCPMCSGAAAWALRRSRPGALEILPCRDEARARRFPGVTERQCMEAMQLVLADGRVYSGEQALPVLLGMLRRWRWLAGLFRLPGAARLSPAVYRWVARHRYAFSVIMGRGGPRHDERCAPGGDCRADGEHDEEMKDE